MKSPLTIPQRFSIVAYSFAVLLAATAAPAQVNPPETGRALRLTLEDAVERAVARNPELAIVKLSNDVETANVAASRSAFTPVFSTVLGRSSNTTPPSNFLLGAQGVNVGDSFASTAVRQRLPWGSGTWSASWESARSTTNSPLSSFDPLVQSGFQLAFSQPLVKDRRVDAARYQYTIAKRNRETSDLRFREAVVQTVAAVKQAYWTLKAAVANVTVQQQSLDLAQELARLNRVRVEAGQNPPLDLVQAEAEVAQRRESLIRSTTMAADAEDALRRLIMDPEDGSFWSVRLDPIEDPTRLESLPDVDAAVRKALSERYDLARAGQELKNAADAVAYHGNQRLPDVRLQVSYGASGLAGTELLRSGGFPGTVTGTRIRGAGDSLSQVFTNDFPAWSLGFTVSHPLGQSFESASLARAEVERQQTEHRIASLRLQIAEAVRRAGRQISSTAERVEAAKAGEQLAQQRLDDERRRFDVGLSTTFLVTQAQRDLVQARVSLLQTMLDYESALVTFEAVQQAPPLVAGDTVGVQGASIVPVPLSAPRGIFRAAGAAGLQP